MDRKKDNFIEVLYCIEIIFKQPHLNISFMDCVTWRLVVINEINGLKLT